MSKGVMVWVHSVDEPDGMTRELLNFGRRLADELGGALCAVVLGEAGDEFVAALAAYGAERVYAVAGAPADAFDAELAEAALVRVCQQAETDLLLLPHTDYGAELAPRTAFRLGSSAAMGCIDGRVEDGRLVMVRPCYGGRACSEVSFRTQPAVATLRPKTQEPAPADAERTADLVVISLDGTPERRIRVRERRRNESSGVRLEEASVVVSGGRGLGGPEGFRILEELASTLGGAVGASRPACDLGWYPHSHQVGISGKTVAPELYIAVGISGAGHHMAGCGRSKVLVAINNDPDAEIFRHVHFGVIGDYQTVVPEIAKALRE